LEWLQTLIATIVGAALAAGVGELNRRAARKDEWLKTRRSKLEEVFAELANGEAQSTRIAIAVLQQQQGMHADPVSPLDMTHLGALLSLYFPEAREVLEAHRKRLEAMRGPRMDRFKEAAKNNDAKAIQRNTLLMTIEMNQEVGQFARELRPTLENIAARLART
jgi:hypothetical protein